VKTKPKSLSKDYSGTNSFPPITDVEFERQTVVRWIEKDIQLAKLTANPLYVWHAILRCIIHHIDFPQLCLDYIACTAVSLSPLIEDARSEKPKIAPQAALAQLAQIMQLTDGKKGSDNAFAKLAKDQECIRDHGSVMASVISGRKSEKQAVREMGERRGLGEANPFSDERGVRQVRKRLQRGQMLVSTSVRTDTRKG